MSNFRRRLHYQIDKIFARGSSAQFLLLALLTLGVVLIGSTGFFLGLFSEANKEVSGISRNLDKGFLDTLWWSLNLVLDAGFFTGNYGATPPILALGFLVTLMGMVIFGIFIGFVTAAVEERLAALRRGDSEVLESGHVLILGWSKKVFAILNLMDEYDSSFTFVVLATHEPEEMQEEVRVYTRPSMKNRVILRRGNPSNLHELERVAFTQARAIILLGEEDEGVGNPDIPVIKTLMLLASIENWPHGRPPVVAEILRHENEEVAQLAARGAFPLVATSDVVSKILVQASRQPGLSLVYAELFAFEGSECYLKAVPAAVGKKWVEVPALFPKAAPIGVGVNKGTEAAPKWETTLNPPADYVVKPEESLILLAEDAGFAVEANAPPHTVEQARCQPITSHGAERVLILGWSQNLYNILAQFDAYVAPGTPVVVISNHDENTARELLDENLPHELANISLELQEGNYIRRSVLEPLFAQPLTCAILLEDHSFEEEDPDARIIMAAVLLRELQKELGGSSQTQMVAEITHHDNRRLLELTKVFDILVSPEITSMLLAQIAIQPALDGVFRDMLDADGVEVYLKPVSRYLPLDKEWTFQDIQVACIRASECTLGLVLGDGVVTPFDVQLNPGRDKVFRLGPADRVIVLAEDMYDSTPE